MLTNAQLYVQFRPGRVDHHNIQITMAVLAVRLRHGQTASARASPRWPGWRAGLGLAIGIEALAFHAMIGASFAPARRRSIPRRSSRPRLWPGAGRRRRLAFFCLQTPPGRWGLPFCDALGANLVVAILIAGLGLAASPTWARARAPSRAVSAAGAGRRWRRGRRLSRRRSSLHPRAVRRGRSAPAADLVRPHQRAAALAEALAHAPRLGADQRSSWR